MYNPFQKTEYASEREKRRARRRFLFRLRQRLIELAVLAVAVTAIVLPFALLEPSSTPQQPVDTEPTVSVPKEEIKPVYPVYTDATVTLPENTDATYAVLVDVTEHRVVAAKGADVRAYPASITKVMTLLVAVENITDFTEKFTMTYAITDPLYIAGASMAGFKNKEEIPIEDLLYGTILPSGADACQALALHVAGSDEAFVALRNQRAAKMGLKNTHFTNTSGLHHAEHYTTAEDMAVILREAMANDHCRQVLSTHKYTTSITPQNPEGISLSSSLFNRMTGKEPDGATVIAGKTGYTDEAGNTLASYAEGLDGHDYILVTLKGTTKQKVIRETIDLYSQYCPATEKSETANNTTSTIG